MRALVFALALVSLGSPSGCKNNSVDQDTTNINNYFTQVIGPEGGRVGEPGSAYVDIPPGALTVRTTITIATAGQGAYPNFPSNSSLLGSVWSFEPHGQTFASEVTLSLPAPVTSTVYVMQASPGGSWRVSQVEANGQAAILRTVSFSYFAVSATNPCTNCVDGGGGGEGGSGTDVWISEGGSGTDTRAQDPDTSVVDTGPIDNFSFLTTRYGGVGLANVRVCVDGDDSSCRTSASSGMVSLRVPDTSPFVLRLSLAGYVPVLLPLDISAGKGVLNPVFLLSTGEQAALAAALATTFEGTAGFIYFGVTDSYSTGVPGITARLATDWVGSGPVYFGPGAPIGISADPYTSSYGSGFFYNVGAGGLAIEVGKATATCTFSRYAPWGAPGGTNVQALPVRAGHVTVMAFYCN